MSRRRSITYSREEAVAFLEKFERIKEIETLSPVLGFIFSRKGFVKEAEDYMIEKGIAYTDDEQWLAV
jgi:hypothetical protein